MNLFDQQLLRLYTHYYPTASMWAYDALQAGKKHYGESWGGEPVTPSNAYISAPLVSMGFGRLEKQGLVEGKPWGKNGTFQKRWYLTDQGKAVIAEMRHENPAKE